jgi:divinyl protochlorophyllide a 8-vinyl-reductase
VTTATASAPPPAATARIGPNAIIQLVAAIDHRWGPDTAATLLAEATPYTPTSLPHDMVDEREPLALVRLLVDRLGADAVAPVLHDAGVRTAEYLLAHRIPRMAQWLIRRLPRRYGLAVLLRAIGAHAWTFAGSGAFSVGWYRGWPTLSFTDCAMCRGLTLHRPICDYYAGTFEHLFRTLVAEEITVTEVACQAQGVPCCRFRVAER